MKLRRGDQVIVISGNDKGKTGEIKTVLLDRNRVIVEGINLRIKHVKPSQQQPQGDRIQLELSVHASNVMLLDPETGKGTRKRPTKD